MSTFKKDYIGKPMVSLVQTPFILDIAKVLTFGAKKYGKNNWKNIDKKEIDRLKDSLLRHTLAYTSGDLIDPDTGLSHSAHAACNLMFLHYFELQGTLNDPKEKATEV